MLICFRYIVAHITQAFQIVPNSCSCGIYYYMLPWSFSQIPFELNTHVPQMPQWHRNPTAPLIPIFVSNKIEICRYVVASISLFLPTTRSEVDDALRGRLSHNSLYPVPPRPHRCKLSRCSLSPHVVHSRSSCSRRYFLVYWRAHKVGMAFNPNRVMRDRIQVRQRASPT